VLNDDRIAWALDVLAEVLDEVTGSVRAAALGAFASTCLSRAGT
jgi:hypothetical protein